MQSCPALSSSFLPLLSLCLSQGVANLSFICKLNNSSLVSVKLCVCANVSMPKITTVILSQWDERQLFGCEGAPQTDIPS